MKNQVKKTLGQWMQEKESIINEYAENFDFIYIVTGEVAYPLFDIWNEIRTPSDLEINLGVGYLASKVSEVRVCVEHNALRRMYVLLEQDDAETEAKQLAKDYSK